MQGSVVMLSTFACFAVGVIFSAEFINILARRLIHLSLSTTMFDYDQQLENTLIIGNPNWAIFLFGFSYYCVQHFKLPDPIVPTYKKA